MRICFGGINLGWIIGFAILAAPVTSSATPVTVSPTNHDTTIFKGGVNNSAGGQNQFYVGTNGNTGSADRGLLSFDLSGIPTSAVVQSVKLTLTLDAVAGAGGGGGGGGGMTDTTLRELDLHAVNDSWGEGTVSTGGGQGAGANSGDATWNARSFGTTNWTTAGGDFNSSVSGAQLIGSVSNVAYNWDSTATLMSDGSTPANNTQMVADVQNWISHPLTNFGWTLINTDETDLRTFRSFYSKENATMQPSLIITFVPEPATSSLLAAGGIALVFLGLRRGIAARKPAG